MTAYATFSQAAIAAEKKRLEDLAAAEKLALAKKAAEEKAALDKSVAATKIAEREKAMIKYEADKAQYAANILSAIASGALAVLQGFAQLGPIGGAIAAIGIGIVTGAQIALMKPPKAPAFAIGTSYAPGGPAMVGEFGPEMVDLPRGAMVHTAEETRQIGGAGSKTVQNSFVFHSPVALTPSEMQTRFVLAQRQAAFQGAF